MPTFHAHISRDPAFGCRLRDKAIPFLHWLVGGLVIALIATLGAWNAARADDEDETVETLAPIEVPGTAVIRKPRQLTFPKPTWDKVMSLPSNLLEQLAIPDPVTVPHPATKHAVLMDPTGKLRGVRTPVTPLKVVRPPYPRFAREQGWEGTVILRITVGPDGRLVSAETQKSSGHPILDRSALHAVRQWTFKPAKDGEFPITATVDLPIRFDLRREERR